MFLRFLGFNVGLRTVARGTLDIINVTKY